MFDAINNVKQVFPLEMLNFLKQTRRFVNAKEPVCIVLGNESCDLDSAVCAISLAYFYQNSKEAASLPISATCNYLPILNIPKRDYPLKTEVKYILEEYNVNEDVLTFRDELNDDFLENNKLVLVDHHVSPWLKNCIAIYDHRPKDESAIMPNTCVPHLSLVGSCATLIAEEFIKSKILHVPEILNLLRSTIVLDTVNFSELAARATPKDAQICSLLEEALKEFNNIQSRDEVFHNLVEARADVSSLTAAQLLRKDYKIVTSSKNENIKVALNGFPLKVQQFILKPNAEEAVRDFAKEYDCSVVLLMGMYVEPKDKSVHRDFGIINIKSNSLCETIEKRVISGNELQLCTERHKDCNFMDGSFYKQHNIKVTRKHILPIIKAITDQ